MSISKGWLGLAALAAAGFQVTALAQSAADTVKSGRSLTRTA